MRFRIALAAVLVAVLADGCGPEDGTSSPSATSTGPVIPAAVAPAGPLVPCPPGWRPVAFWLQALELHDDEYYGIPGLDVLLVVAALMERADAVFIDRTNGMPVAKGEFTAPVKMDSHGVFVYNICVPPDTISVGLTATVHITELQRLSCWVENERGVDPNSLKVVDREDTLMPGIATPELVQCEWYAADPLH